MTATGAAAALSKNRGNKVAHVQCSVFLLWLLSKKEMHGYEIIKEIGSDPMVGRMNASRIYPLLAGLTNKKLVSQKTVMQGRRARKLYRLTPLGKEALRNARDYLKRSALIVRFMEDMLR
jgi:PadR family transcriptional regulator